MDINKRIAELEKERDNAVAQVKHWTTALERIIGGIIAYKEMQNAESEEQDNVEPIGKAKTGQRGEG